MDPRPRDTPVHVQRWEGDVWDRVCRQRNVGGWRPAGLGHRTPQDPALNSEQGGPALLHCCSFSLASRLRRTDRVFSFCSSSSSPSSFSSSPSSACSSFLPSLLLLFLFNAYQRHYAKKDLEAYLFWYCSLIFIDIYLNLPFIIS